jgi:CheY-like chemotaxis protein
MAKILLVDDVYTARSMIERVLARVGRHEVLAVGSGQDALDAARVEQPDIVVLDISMAGMDGVTTLQQLRSLGLTSPVIAYTARSERTQGEFVGLGFTAYVQKNGNLTNLLTTIREIVGADG